MKKNIKKLKHCQRYHHTRIGAQTAAPSSLPACATDLFLFRHFSLASPGQCQVNLLQKKENKTQNTKKQQRLALYLSISTKALPQGPTAALPTDRPNTCTQKKGKKNCTTLLGVEPSRDPRSPAEPGRAAGAGSALIVLLYDKERPPPHRHLPVCSPTPSECQVPVTRVRS